MSVERDGMLEITTKGGEIVRTPIPEPYEGESPRNYEFRKKIAIKEALQAHYARQQTGLVTRGGQADQNALLQVLAGLRSHNAENLLERVNSRPQRRTHHNKYAQFSKKNKRP